MSSDAGAPAGAVTAPAGSTADPAGTGDVRRRRHVSDLVLVAVLAVVTVVYATQAVGLPSTSPNQADIGPRAYPFLVAALLALVTIGLGAHAIVGLVHTRRGRVGRSTSQHLRTVPLGQRLRTPDAARLFRLTTLVVATGLYLQVMVVTGFVPATVLFLVAATLLLQRGRVTGRRVLLSAVYSVIGSLAVWGIFDAALGVLLPPGLMGLSP